MASLPKVGSSAFVTRSRAAVCKPVCAFKAASRTATKSVKTAPDRNKRSQPVVGTQYLGLAGFSAVAGTAFTLAPQQFWELLGSRDIVDVTLSSSEVRACNWVVWGLVFCGSCSHSLTPGRGSD